jgi:DNA-binding response OmpR family regulator
MPIALIVEDEPEANRLLALLVQLRGFRAESAHSGAEALELARRRSPDIVFLDLMLPDANGYDVCRELKAHRETSAIPVVMVTARLEDENRLRSFRVGAEEYIPKPYTPDQIFGALACAASWRRSVEQAADHGEILIDTRDEPAALKRLQALATSLLARSDADEAEVDRLRQALLDLCREAVEWGRRHTLDGVATVGYELEADRVVLTVDDVGGWFRGGRPASERLAPILARARFDEVDEEPGGERIVLTKRIPTRDSRDGA